MLFTEYFGLSKTQLELDFVDSPVEKDIKLFVDPFAISQREDNFSRNCNRSIIAFFQHIVDAIRSNDLETARYLTTYFKEPAEIGFGFSVSTRRGRGMQRDGQAKKMLDALQESSAVKTGFIHYIEESELLIDGIGRDKISDLTASIIRNYLAEYTKQQCDLYNIPTQNVLLKPYYSPCAGKWITNNFDLPIVMGQSVLLVPKAFARYDPAYNRQDYYNNFVITTLQEAHLSANSSLVQTLRNGQKRVYKKDVKADFKLTTQNLYIFCKDHPSEMNRYRAELERLEINKNQYRGKEGEEELIANSLIAALKSIPSGNDSAREYHRMMIGIIEFIFFPHLLYPQKEVEINEGRKRIDITMENGARQGILNELHSVRHLPCNYVPFECKNYSLDIANPELDQISDRFSLERGILGFLCCRQFQDRPVFLERCRDSFKEDRGLIIPLDDERIIQLLLVISNNKRNSVENIIRQYIDEIWRS